jgi:hypothetical protein
MKKIFGAVKAYAVSLTLLYLLAARPLAAVAVFLNYYFGINAALYRLPDVQQYAGWFFIFFIVFFSGYAIQASRTMVPFLKKPHLSFFTVGRAGAVCLENDGALPFSFYNRHFENAYWNHVVYWPLKLLVITLALVLVWRSCSNDQPFYGTTSKGLGSKTLFYDAGFDDSSDCPCSYAKGFFEVYPKLKNIAFLKRHLVLQSVVRAFVWP